MTRRRWLVRVRRGLRRPSFTRLAVASLALHLAGITLAVWLTQSSRTPLPKPPEPLIVELPPAAPGPPLVRPEVPSPPAPAPSAPSVAPSPPRVARPPTPEAPKAPPPPPVPRPPEPVPAPVAPAPPPPPAPPPAIAAPEPLPAPPAPVARATPEASRAAPEPLHPTPEPPPSAARAPEPAESSAGARPPALPPSAPSGPAREPVESPFAGRAFSLLPPKLDVPPLPGPSLPHGGGTRPEGEGAGEAGREQDGQAAIPLNTPDPRYADYFPEIKKRIESNWVYPQEAARKGQSGQLVLEFVVRKDGHVLVELVRSSGIDILDRYAINAVKLSAPFPPIPARMGLDSVRITASFTYLLDHGFRLFGIR